MTNALSSLPRTLPRRLEASSFITLLFTARFGSFICGKSSTYGSVVLLLPLYTPSPSTRRINAAQPGLMMIIFFYTYILIISLTFCFGSFCFNSCDSLLLPYVVWMMMLLHLPPSMEVVCDDVISRSSLISHLSIINYLFYLQNVE